jgi:CHAD domain-containing protein
MGLLQSLAEIGSRYDPDGLHRVRIESRKLRYLLELGDELRGADSDGPKLLKEIQGQLGRIHDNYVLAQWFSAQAARAADRGERELEMEAARQESISLEQCRKHHQEFLSGNPAVRIFETMSLLGRGGAFAPPLLPLVGRPSAER